MGGFNSAMEAKPAAQANNDLFTGSGDSKSVREEGFVQPAPQVVLPTSSGMSAAQAPSAAVSQGLLESAGSFAAGGQAWLGETGGDRPRNGDGWPGASAKIAQPTAPRQDERQVPQGGLLTSLAQEPRQNKPRDPLFPISAEAAKGTGREAGFSGGSARNGQGGILEMMADYPQWREGYLRNYDRRQQEILNIAAPNPNPSQTYASNEQRPRSDAMGGQGNQSGGDHFDKIVRGTFRREGGYVNDKEDKGGETNFGVTANTLEEYQKRHGGFGKDGSYVDVENLTQEQARLVYKSAFYDSNRIGEIKDGKTAEHVFDMNVLHQPKPAGSIIQQAINASIPDANLKVDGIVGSKTIEQLNKASPDQLKAINNEIVKGRIELMRKIVQNDPTQSKFLGGWINRANQFWQP